MHLAEYLQSKSDIRDKYFEKILQVFRVETYKKGTIILSPDNRSQKVIFVESGLLRMYYQLDGKTVTFLFIAENALILPLESVFYNKPDPYGWEVLQDCQLQSTLYPDLNKLIDTVPRFERFMLDESFRVHKQMADKLYGIQLLNAEQRYKKLLEGHPTILQSAPLGHIASYLGITQQHLSVIRSKIY